MRGLYFEDLAAGRVFESARHTVSRSEIIEFARAYDPNAFHLDPAAAHALGMTDVIASGFHTLSLSFRLFFELHPWDDAILPSPGLDNVRFLKPLYPGDTLFVRATVLESLPSRSKPDRGIVRMSHETFNAVSRELVLSAEAMHRLRCRGGRSNLPGTAV